MHSFQAKLVLESDSMHAVAWVSSTVSLEISILFKETKVLSSLIQVELKHIGRLANSLADSLAKNWPRKWVDRMIDHFLLLLLNDRSFPFVSFTMSLPWLSNHFRRTVLVYCNIFSLI